MGGQMSLLGKGLSPAQMLNMVMGSLYQKFTEKRMEDFDDFHIAVLDIFNNFNSSLPGEHYDLPTQEVIEECFDKWNEVEDEEKKKAVFVEFMRNNIKPSKLDDMTMMTGVLTPPAALAAKKAGQNLPQLKLIKAVPDVLFVPSVTILALVSAKLSRRMFHK